MKAFSEKTYAPVLLKDFDSARFIQICGRFFRICNVRCINKDPSNFFASEKEIRCVTQLHWLSAFAKAMNNSNISRDTRSALNRYVDNITHLCTRLLSSPDYEYVLLGRYQSDDVERLFSKLRQKVGGGYFITHQQASHATRIMLAKHALRAQNANESEDLDFRNHEGHACSQCERSLLPEEEEAKEFAFIIVASGEVSPSIRDVIVYVGGFLVHKDKINLDSDDCPSEWLKYQRTFDHGGLSVASLDLVNYLSMCYVFFSFLNPSRMCMRFLVRNFRDFLVYFPSLREVPQRSIQRLSNILCNNLSKLSRESDDKSGQKAALKFR